MRNINILDTKKHNLSRKSISKKFDYIESLNGDVDFSIIDDLIMKGEHEGNVLYVIRDCTSRDHTRILTENFNKVIQQRGSHRNNDGFVSVQQIGASQFAKNGQQFMQASNQAFSDMSDLFDSISHDVFETLFLESFLEQNFLKKGVHFGPSSHKHGHAGIATFRRWLDNGVMSLMPHEDKAQLVYASQDGFEISKAHTVIAHNLCVDATGFGGELTVWNIQPNDECRKHFGVLDTGYPYPPIFLRGVEKFEVKLNAGDMYFMNGCYIHGVKNVINGNRITAGRFMGFIGNNKVVYWT